MSSLNSKRASPRNVYIELVDTCDFSLRLLFSSIWNQKRWHVALLVRIILATLYSLFKIENWVYI